MANDIRIIPASASIQFSGSLFSRIYLNTSASGSVSFIGTSGSLLTINDTLTENKLQVFGNISASSITASLNGSDMRLPIRTVTNNYTLTSADYTVLCNSTASITLTLPTATTELNRIYNIKKIDAFGSIVTVTGSNNIDGTTFKLITERYTNMSIHSDGTQWWIL